MASFLSVNRKGLKGELSLTLIAPNSFLKMIVDFQRKVLSSL